ncbi:MAG: RdgB/HAM1 family non-canonical purine NTP pyrophosphatase [Anaerolineae bacterium]
MELLIATENPGKKSEFQLLFASLGAKFSFPSELGLQVGVLEDGTTYAENARKKALAYMHASGLPTLADDSGLEVDALNGAPGIRSARYTPGHDTDRSEALLAQLRDVPWEQRTARFCCVIAIATSTEELFYAEGACEGLIAFEPVGQGGFGYDPVFYLPEHGCTMAQLPQKEKNRISHRARAAQAAMPILRRLLAQDTSARRQTRPPEVAATSL